MLTKITEWADCLPIIKKRIDGEDVSFRGSFEFGECPELTVEAPRKLGASAVVLRFCQESSHLCLGRINPGVGVCGMVFLRILVESGHAVASQ